MKEPRYLKTTQFAYFPGLHFERSRFQTSRSRSTRAHWTTITSHLITFPSRLNFTFNFRAHSYFNKQINANAYPHFSLETPSLVPQSTSRQTRVRSQPMSSLTSPRTTWTKSLRQTMPMRQRVTRSWSCFATLTTNWRAVGRSRRMR